MIAKLRRWMLAGDMDYSRKSYYGHDAIFRREIIWHGKRIDSLAVKRKSWLRDKLIVWHALRRNKVERMLVNLSANYLIEIEAMERRMEELSDGARYA